MKKITLIAVKIQLIRPSTSENKKKIQKEETYLVLSQVCKKQVWFRGPSKKNVHKIAVGQKKLFPFLA